MASCAKALCLSPVARLCAGWFAAVCLVSLAAPARAQLIASPSFNEVVAAENNYTTPLGDIVEQNVTIDSLPYQNTITEDDALGGTITTTFSLTDNGSVANIIITSSGSVTPYNSVFEGHSQGRGDSFILTQAVNYSMILEDEGSGSSEVILSGESGGTNALQLFLGVSDTTETFTGVTGPGLLGFDNEWATSNDGLNPPPDLSGSASLSITFTAIPEPSSMSLVALAIPALLRRRRRSMLHGHSASQGPVRYKPLAVIELCNSKNLIFDFLT
jgi:hypothetical protein